MGKYHILLAPGDGIGPEIIQEAVKVLGKIADQFGHQFEYDKELVGGAAIDAYGIALRDECITKAKAADAILFGAVGDPKYDDPSSDVRPEQALLGLRGSLQLFANLRPVKIYGPLINGSPLKPEIVKGTDIMVIRELTGGIYFGKPQRRWVSDNGREAVDTMAYTEAEVERIIHVAFKVAQKRTKRVASVDKANVLDTSRLWREVTVEVAAEYPDVTLEHVLVDACAMHLINNPTRFDVIVTENMFGDILTDEASMLSGSLGMMPSASLGTLREDGTGFGMFEPIHGSAPDITGQGIANPIGTIMSAAMMLRLSFGLEKEAAAIEAAVDKVLDDGKRTADIASGGPSVSTAEMGTLIADRVSAPA
ncbi:MAG: 3-isopropylmalate dehydrogenase [Proteobacteria bacterium]|nr:3-isopropylmalate dehydrogenase [Pseudomonadota bacterium]